MLSLKKNVKRLFKKKKTLKHEKLYSFILFTSFCFRLLWLWFVFLDSVSVLRFNFVFFWVCFLLGMLISVLGFVFLFSGSVFLFWVSHFVLCVSVLGLFSPIFVVVVVVLWFFCFYQPPYIFDSPLHLNPTTGEHFKTPLKISSQRSNRSGKK